ncbi:hypothetical protein [Streptomyces blattellae]|uniref:hypothetical protein n=1 Tax=Streptomyces blattellae TaxID=2569855 RepID=UPI0012B88F11|nr:hypothetical protein [Streptomyces blattellae]
MSRAKGSQTPYGWTTKKEFGSDVPPGKRALATELQRLCRLLALNADGNAPTQKQAADRLHVSDTSLSRYLSAEYLPDIGIVRDLHAIARTDAGGMEEAGITLTDLERLHSEAAAEQCGSCVKLREEVSALQQQAVESAVELSTVQAELGAVQKEGVILREGTAALKREVRELKAREVRTLKTSARRAIRAGQRSRLTARADAALLPVPPRKGDRQQSNPEKRAALTVARQAEALQNGGRQDGVLALLRHSAEVLSPAEAAALVCVLREGQLDELAGTLIHIYGRDNPDPHVMRAAAQLHQHGAPDDAAALLQAALSTRQGAP